MAARTVDATDESEPEPTSADSALSCPPASAAPTSCPWPATDAAMLRVIAASTETCPWPWTETDAAKSSTAIAANWPVPVNDALAS